ncbi:MAG: hypothetical protein K9H16_04935 [Bacteroidales bacterium]|nr:hypothetical protein [Bacteroidales bacterium]
MMTDKFHGKYRIPSARLKNWDYGSQATYFVTVNTLKHICYFGEIRNKQMLLNDLGKCVNEEWIKTPEIRPDMNLELGVFVVMPNHFHAIIIIGENEYNQSYKKSEFGPQSKNLASIMRGFKSSVTTFARKSGLSYFEWQERYHDHIIRDTQAFENIQNYIIDNPAKWDNDKFYKA